MPFEWSTGSTVFALDYSHTSFKNSDCYQLTSVLYEGFLFSSLTCYNTFFPKTSLLLNWVWHFSNFLFLNTKSTCESELLPLRRLFYCIDSLFYLGSGSVLGAQDFGIYNHHWQAVTICDMIMFKTLLKILFVFCGCPANMDPWSSTYQGSVVSPALA